MSLLGHTLSDAMKAAMRRYLHELMLATAGHVTLAAKTAGRNRTEFYRLLEKHGIKPNLYRGIA